MLDEDRILPSDIGLLARSDFCDLLVEFRSFKDIILRLVIAAGSHFGLECHGSTRWPTWYNVASVNGEESLADLSDARAKMMMARKG